MKWQHHVDNPVSFLKKDGAECKGLLPLLLDSLRKNEITPDKTFQTYLRTAYLRAEIRSHTYRRICGDVLSAFTREGIVTVALKGAALAETVYTKPELQHSHYLDILINEDDFLSARRLLPSLGFESLNKEMSFNCKRMLIRHESRLPLVLQSNLFHIPFYNISMADIWARSRTEVIADVPTRLLSCADNLTHICGSALNSEPHESLRWVCDAWFLINHHHDLDWDILLNCARCKRLGLPLYITLNYLKEKLNADIAINVLDKLNAIASQTDTIGRETALFEVRVNSRIGFKNMLKLAENWRARGMIIKWIFFPSPSYLLCMRRISSRWLLPFFYFYRPMKYTALKLFQFLKSRIFHMNRRRIPDSLSIKK